MKRTVSVIVPCHNQGRYLNEAVDSVLAQSYPSVELIVINDGSTDETSDVARAYGGRIRLLEQECQGRSAARNRGLDESKGELVKFLDADDKLDHECLERQVDALGPDDAWNEAASVTFQDDSWELTPHFACLPEVPMWRRLLIESGLQCGAILVAAETLRGIRFRSGYEWGEDTTFWSDVWARLGHPEYVPFVKDAVCLIRQHPQQTHTTTTQRDVLRFVAELIRSWEEHFLPENPWAVRECVERLIRVAAANINGPKFDRQLHRQTLDEIRAFCRRHDLGSFRTVASIEAALWEKRMRALVRPLVRSLCPTDVRR